MKVTRGLAVAAINVIANRLPLPRLQKLLETAWAVEAEKDSDLEQGEKDRTARAKVKQAEIDALKAAGRHFEAQKAEREP